MNCTVNLPKTLRRHAEMTVRVKSSGLWRVKLGVMIMKIGARITGMRVRVERE
jgi:hypothetical protein